jgi:hypothetical protein
MCRVICEMPGTSEGAREKYRARSWLTEPEIRDGTGPAARHRRDLSRVGAASYHVSLRLVDGELNVATLADLGRYIGCVDLHLASSSE